MADEDDEVMFFRMDDVSEEVVRKAAGNNVRDMFVAIGFLLGSIVATAGFTAYRNTTLTLGVITIFFKIFVSIVAYVATAKRNGKIMIFAAICGGLASAVSAYLAVTGFTNWANKQFRSDYIPYIAQLIVDILVYVHVTYFAVVLL
ncbi:hypothetical protein ANCCAN_17097 [Ancylostoma caninum]|uniref:Uncharacterized protein n=1 Tax=Ancylostoma caninum TaxID=29170 RepID=A0A368FY40_ANCCA|nr:hypothetical protein ANCCAN_17097 [Ancylostoma caninum]